MKRQKKEVISNMAGMYEQFKTDVKSEQEGIVIDYGSFRVTLARAGGANKRYAKLLNAMIKPYRRALETDTMDDQKSEEIVMEVFAKTIVLNWETLVNGKWKRGIENPEGGDLLSFTVQNVMKVFTDLPDLFTDIREQSGKASLYRLSLKEAAAKN